MLRLSLPKLELFNEKTEEFVEVGGQVVDLEHSLYTISGWESKWKTPFSKKKGLSRQQLSDYIINYMCQTQDVPKSSWACLDQTTFKQIEDYIGDPMTATTINRHGGAGRINNRRENVTAELLYFYMIQFGIPFECEHWHLNRLMTLIDVCAVKQTPPRKMTGKEAAAMRAAQNEAMRTKFKSKG